VVKERPLQDLQSGEIIQPQPVRQSRGAHQEREVKPPSCFATMSRRQGSWISAIHVPHSEPPLTHAYSPATQTFVWSDGATAALE
jgi:hypothetical protein